MANFGEGNFSFSSVVVFKNKSNVTFYNNSAIPDGGAMVVNNSKIYFAQNSIITFANNIAKSVQSHGSALFSTNILFGKNHGGLYCENFERSFDGNLTVAFYNNTAVFGGTMCSRDHSAISFYRNSKVTFSAWFRGAINSILNSQTSFYGNATVIYKGNNANDNGGAIISYQNSTIKFDVESKVTVKDNTAKVGGAVHSEQYSGILFDGNTTVTYQGNEGSGLAGCYQNCHITFDENSKVIFSGNKSPYGGAVVSRTFSTILFVENTMITFEGNKASVPGGAVMSYKNANIRFGGNSKVTFNNNEAEIGGAVHSEEYREILFDGNSTVTYSIKIM